MAKIDFIKMFQDIAVVVKDTSNKIKPEWTQFLVDGTKRVGIIVDRYVYPKVVGVVQMNKAAMNVTESAKSVVIQVDRVNGVDGPASVKFTTTDATAKAGVDYVATSGTLNWLDQESASKFITITINDNAVVDASRSFTVNLSAATGSTLGAVVTTVTITNDDQELPPPPPPGDAVLLNWNNFVYKGGFRVPNAYDGLIGFSFAGYALDYNPATNSLFICVRGNYVTEISIPAPVNSNKLTDLPVCEIIQPWVSVTDKLQNPLTDAGDGQYIGDLMVWGDKIIGTVYPYYTGAMTQVATHFVMDSLDLSKANVTGLFQVGTGGRVIAGYMTPVPDAWVSRLGKALTGLSGKPIISTISCGPTVTAFDPDNLSASTTRLLWYSLANPLGQYTGPANPLNSGNADESGVLFVPGTDTVLFVGRTGTNYNGYGGAEWLDPAPLGQGQHALFGEYAVQFIAYDAHDLLKVKNGEKQPWEIKPYVAWNPQIPFADVDKKIGGIAYDPTQKRLYVCAMQCDTSADLHAYLPVIHVFDIVESSDTHPNVGSVCVSPEVIPGPVKANTQVDLLAGNCYGVNSAITRVEFFFDGQSVGIGSPDVSVNPNNWKLRVPMNLPVGEHIVWAKAISANGLKSDLATQKFTVVA